MINKSSINEKAKFIKDYWSPIIIGELNGQYIKLAKIKGEFIWHKHENEDEFFQVIEGQMLMHLRDRIIEVNKGELIIIQKNTEHKPVANIETLILLFEPKSTLNTGNQISDLTKFDLDFA